MYFLIIFFIIFIENLFLILIRFLNCTFFARNQFCIWKIKRCLWNFLLINWLIFNKIFIRINFSWIWQDFCYFLYLFLLLFIICNFIKVILSILFIVFPSGIFISISIAFGHNTLSRWWLDLSIRFLIKVIKIFKNSLLNWNLFF